MLVGRKSECDRIARLLDAARLGRTGALVLRGEAGIGKTALLAWAEEQAWDMRVLHAHGVEQDAELLFAGLLELCKPLLCYLDAIPEPQARALRSALALGPVVPGDRFAVSAATMSLLAAAAEEKPLLVLIDDAHWLDAASADALLFAARRLAADSIAFLATVREGEGEGEGEGGVFGGSGLEEVELRGLDIEAAQELLSRAVGEDAALGVRERLHHLAGGNPLALLEFAAALSREQFAGTELFPQPLPVGERLKSTFARAADRLSEPARRALVVAAANWSEDLEAVQLAARALGLANEALDEVVDSGLMRLDGGRLRFRHPLVRSSIYQAAPPSERRSVHGALAEALHGRRAERAWHRAAATTGTDEAVASELERVAREAHERSGYAAAATAFERAARLSGSETHAGRRLFEGANAAYLGGQPRDAIRLLDEALPKASDPNLRAQIIGLRGRIAHLDAQPEARDFLLEAARLVEDIDPGRAVMFLADVLESYVFAGVPNEMLEIANRMQALAIPDDERQQFRTNLALGGALQDSGRYDEGAEFLRRALEIAVQSDAIKADPYELVHACLPATRLGRTVEATKLARVAIARAREHSAIGALPFALRLNSGIEFSLGNWNGAYAAAFEGADLARETAQRSQLCGCLVVLAHIDAGRGHETACGQHAHEAIDLASRLDLPRFRAHAEFTLALLELTIGHPREAAERLESMVDPGTATRPPSLKSLRSWAAADLVEAHVRAGDIERARGALVRHVARADEQNEPFFRPLACRCRGLTAADQQFDQHFEAALALHRESQEPFEEARTRLCYGERLRRLGERRRARTELRTALATFETLGAAPWAERAVKELHASGARLHRRDLGSVEQLTGQELQIAIAVAEGRSNRDVAAGLFLSPKTVEWHLTRIYRKLDISSRAELIRLLATRRLQDQPAVIASAEPAQEPEGSISASKLPP